MTPKIRPAQPSDEELVIDFNRKIARETEHRELDVDTLRRGVRAALADDRLIRYFIAELEGQVVGQAGITWEWSDWRNGWFWWLQSVYVLPEARRKGVFSALYRAIADAGRREAGVVGLRLYMERDNTVAQRTYQRMGMKLSEYVLLEQMMRP